jgi:hypothetical protein
VRSNTAGNITLASSDAGDNPAGAGAAAAIVEYIDADGYERFGVAILNGITSADVNQAYVDDDGEVVVTGPVASGIRVNRAYVSAMGAAAAFRGFCIGNIDVSIGANVQTRIGAGRNYGYGSHFTVPRGRIGILQSIKTASDENSNVHTEVYFQQWGMPALQFAQQEQDRGIFELVGESKRLAARTDVWLTIERVNNGGLDAGCSMDIVIAYNPSDPDPEPEKQPPRFG